MTNLNQLQSELAALTERVNSAMSVTEGSFTLTRDELKQLINKVQEQTKEYIETEEEYIKTEKGKYVYIDLKGFSSGINNTISQIFADLEKDQDKEWKGRYVKIMLIFLSLSYILMYLGISSSI